MAINKNKVMEVAQKFVEKGQTDKAIKEYLKVVQEDPKDVRVWLKIGDLYAKKGAKTEATETYLKVAQFYGEQGFYLKAVAVYKQILKIDSRLVDVNIKLADVYRQLGLLSDAMQQYELVAAFYHREGKTKEALKTIKDLVELDPENVATRIKLAELYSKEGMAAEAIGEFAKACEYLRAHNRMDDFIKVAERLVWHQPDNHGMNRELATLYLRRNDPRRALQKLQACFKADPRDVETLALLAQAFQALDQKPKTVSVWKELARIHQENGANAQAQDVYRKILSLAPDDADALAALGGRRAPHGTGGVPAIPAPAAAPAPPPTPQGSPFPRVATPIAVPQPRRTGEVPRIAEPIVASIPIEPPPPRSSRQTGSIPLVADPFPTDDSSRFDLDDERPPGSTQTKPAARPGRGGDTTSRRDGNEVELELDDVGAGTDEMILGAGADPAEAHADEIVKILTETDVYIKYGLHQKAIEHLKKIFELDSRNSEAREKLKDIFVALGRNAEAASELVRLAELTAATNPEQAAGYLRELFAIDPGDARGRAVAERFRIPVELPGEPSTGEIEVEADDYGLAVSTSDLESGVANSAESDVPMDLDEVNVDAAADGSDDGDMPDVAVEAATADADGVMEFDFDDLGGSSMNEAGASRESTQQVSADQVLNDVGEMEQADAGELEFDEAQSSPPQQQSRRGFDGGSWGAAGPATTEAAPEYEPAAPRGGKTRTARPGEETFDADLDADYAALGGAPPAVDEFELDAADAAIAESLGDVDPAQAAQDLDTGGSDAPAPSGGGLEDELDEADFFVGQNLFDEARGILDDLLGRYPNHPLVLAKMADLDAMSGDAGQSAPPPLAPPPPAPVVAAPTPAPAPAVKRPSVIARPLGGEDADTHYDLGLAYKEMGLYDEACKEFALVRDVPGKAVECHLMIGLCHAERGKFSEAVGEFKNGLYVEGISDRQSLALYYELGAAYEALADAREAIYYFEKVVKKDPRFREVDKRLTALRAAAAKNGGGNAQKKTNPGRDEVSDAVDMLGSDEFSS